MKMPKLQDKEVRVRISESFGPNNTITKNYYVYVVDVEGGEPLPADVDVRYSWKPFRVIEFIAATLRLGRLPPISHGVDH